MKAVAIVPGQANSAHLAELPMPQLEDAPGDRGVLVRVLRVGLCGTDREIDAGEYGVAPAGESFLVLGHESIGLVERVGAAVSELSPGDDVVARVRHPGGSIYDAIGMPDLTTDDVYYEHGINRLHGFLTEYYLDTPEFLVRIPSGLREVGVLLEPTSIIEKGIIQAFEIQRRLRIWQPRRAAVLGAGTIGLLATMALRLRGLEVVTLGLAEPPNLNAELIESLGGRYVSTRQQTLEQVSDESGPFDIIFEATGYSPLVFQAMQVLGKNGVLVLSSVTGGDRRVEVPADAINLGFVLGNKVMVGTVNANREHFEAGVRDLALAESQYGGWLSRLLTHRVAGLEHYRQAIDLLSGQNEAIKIVVEVAA